MAYPVSGNYEARVSGSTVIKKAWGDEVDATFNKLFGGTHSVKSLYADNIGNLAYGLPNPGSVGASGDLIAGLKVDAGTSVEAGTFLKSAAAKSSATPGAGQAVAAGQIWKDTVISAWGKFRVTAGPAITFDRGANIASVGRSGLGIYTVTLQTAVPNLQNILVTPMDSQAGIAVIDSAGGGGSAATTSVFRILYFDQAGAPTDPNANVGGFFFAVIGG